MRVAPSPVTLPLAVVQAIPIPVLAMALDVPAAIGSVLTGVPVMIFVVGAIIVATVVIVIVMMIVAILRKAGQGSRESGQ